jgi:acetyltransferase
VATVGVADHEVIIGVARYAADDDGIDCEFALAVADAWQCRGIGTTLAPMLFEYAATQGFRRVYGYLLPGNDRMLALCRYLGLTVDSRRADNGLVRAWRNLA